MLQTLDRLLARLVLACTAIAGLFLVAMMALACANMLLRAGWLPLEGTFELMGFFGATVTALSLAFAQRHKSHIAVGLAAEAFPRGLRRALDALSHLAGCAFFALAAWETLAWGLFLVDTGELSGTLHIPYHPFVFTVAAGLFVMALQLGLDTLLALAGPRAGKEA